MIVKRTAKFHTTLFLPNFKIEDFFCRCGVCDPQKIDLAAVVMLQALRDLIKRPIGVNSAYRCAEHNKNSGGKPNSPHLDGLAFDIYSTGMSGYDLARAAWEVGWRSVGISEFWCHIDRRPRAQGVNYNFWIYPPLDFNSTRTRFLKDVGYTGNWGG